MIPVDISGWRAEIVNVKFSYPVYIKRGAEVMFLHYMFAIYSSVFVRISFHCYFFYNKSTFSMCCNLVHHPVSRFSFLTSSKVTIASDSIVINFVSLLCMPKQQPFFLYFSANLF